MRQSQPKLKVKSKYFFCIQRKKTLLSFLLSMAVQNTLMHSYFMSDQSLSCNCRYEAKPPKDIKFVPLNQVKEYTAEQLMELYSVSEFLIIFWVCLVGGILLPK